MVTYIRVVDGYLRSRDRIDMMSTGAHHELLEIGVSSPPEPSPTKGVGPGEVGYLITGVKDVRQSKVGDTITTSINGGASEPLAGYSDPPKPMVFSGLFPIDGSDYPNLRDALDKLKLNDAALNYEPETSTALGFGFRVGGSWGGCCTWRSSASGSSGSSTWTSSPRHPASSTTW